VEVIGDLVQPGPGVDRRPVEDRIVERLGKPRWSPAFSLASRSTSVLGRPVGSTARSRRTAPAVSVPVLSVHSTVIAPKSSMASSRLTITLAAAIRRAPADRLTVTMAGSSGVSPTASASENSTELITGRCRTRLIAKMTVTSTTIARTRAARRTRWMPRSNLVLGRRAPSRADTAPNCVARPVLATTASPAPLTTWVPMNRLFERLARGVAASTTPGRFSTDRTHRSAPPRRPAGPVTGRPGSRPAQRRRRRGPAGRR
jgi:hypothetical protein